MRHRGTAAGYSRRGGERGTRRGGLTFRVCPSVRFTTVKVGVSSTPAPSSFHKLGSQPKLADSSSGLNCAGAGAGAAGLTDAVGLTDAAIRVPDAGPVALAGAAARRRWGTISAPPTATAATAPEAITRA